MHEVSLGLWSPSMSHQKGTSCWRTCSLTTGHQETWAKLPFPSPSALPAGSARWLSGLGQGQSLKKLSNSRGCQSQASFHAVTRGKQAQAAADPALSCSRGGLCFPKTHQISEPDGAI